MGKEARDEFDEASAENVMATQDLNGLPEKSSLCTLCVLCVSVVNDCLGKTTTEAQRTQRGC
jgi:hypothetical protein